MGEVSAEDEAQRVRDKAERDPPGAGHGTRVRTMPGSLRVGEGLALSHGLDGTEIRTRELLFIFIWGDYNPECPHDGTSRSIKGRAGDTRDEARSRKRLVDRKRPATKTHVCEVPGRSGPGRASPWRAEPGGEGAGSMGRAGGASRRVETLHVLARQPARSECVCENKPV